MTAKFVKVCRRQIILASKDSGQERIKPGGGGLVEHLLQPKKKRVGKIEVVRRMNGYPKMNGGELFTTKHSDKVRSNVKKC